MVLENNTLLNSKKSGLNSFKILRAFFKVTDLFLNSYENYPNGSYDRSPNIKACHEVFPPIVNLIQFQIETIQRFIIFYCTNFSDEETIPWTGKYNDDSDSSIEITSVLKPK